MPTLSSVDTAHLTGKTKELVDFVQQRSGRVPNMVRLLANSPAALGAYLNFAGAFREAALSQEIQSLVAVAVAQACGCDYTLSAVFRMGANSGVTAEALEAARSAEAKDDRTAAALKFAVEIVKTGARVPEARVDALRRLGFADAEIAEIVAAICLNIYRCYFNLVARPDVDFPVVSTTSAHASDEPGSTAIALESAP